MRNYGNREHTTSFGVCEMGNDWYMHDSRSAKLPDFHKMSLSEKSHNNSKKTISVNTKVRALDGKLKSFKLIRFATSKR